MNVKLNIAAMPQPEVYHDLPAESPAASDRPADAVDAAAATATGTVDNHDSLNHAMQALVARFTHGLSPAALLGRGSTGTPILPQRRASGCSLPRNPLKRSADM